jgi:hypothetical protein
LPPGLAPVLAPWPRRVSPLHIAAHSRESQCSRAVGLPQGTEGQCSQNCSYKDPRDSTRLRVPAGGSKKARRTIRTANIAFFPYCPLQLKTDLRQQASTLRQMRFSGLTSAQFGYFGQKSNHTGRSARAGVGRGDYLRRRIKNPASTAPASKKVPGSGETTRKPRISPPGFPVVWMFR